MEEVADVYSIVEVIIVAAAFVMSDAANMVISMGATLSSKVVFPNVLSSHIPRETSSPWYAGKSRDETTFTIILETTYPADPSGNGG